MNVLIISESFWPEGSGGELATYLYAKLLAKSDVDIRIIVTSSSVSSKGEVDGLPVYKISGEKLSKYTTMNRIPILLRRPLNQFFKWSNIVYVTGWFPAIPLIKRKFRKPVVVHLHSYFPACPLGSLYNLKESSICNPDNHPRTCAKCIAYYEKAHMKSTSEVFLSALLNSTIGRSFNNFIGFADAAIFVSKAQKNLFLKHAPSIVPISHVVYNPLPKLPHTPIMGDDLGYFGGLSPLKGLQVLMKAWARILCERHYDVKIHMTKMDDLHGFRSLERVRMIPYGRLTEKSYEDIYKRIRAVIIPSIWPEPLPYVVSEALLRGRLVVASHVGGIPEQLKGFEGVRLVKPGDVDELADAIDEALTMDREKAVELGLKNREGILRKFDNLRTVKELMQVFDHVLM